MGLDEEVAEAYELANPPGMSADGLQRYWKKVAKVTAVIKYRSLVVEQ
jgi:hypothetical protein